MNSFTAAFLLALVALMTARGMAAPISGYNSNSTDPSNSTDAILNSSTATNVTAISTNISTLQNEALEEITSVFQEITALEKYYVSY